MQFNSDLLDQYAENEGYSDWEIVPQSEESPHFGDLVIKFIKY